MLRELKRRARAERTTVGHLVSRLVAASLGARPTASAPDLAWTSAPMQALVDLRDKDALRRALDDR